MTILDCSMMQNSFLSIPRFLRYMHRSGIRTEYNRVQFFVMKILKSLCICLKHTSKWAERIFNSHMFQRKTCSMLKKHRINIKICV